MFTGQSSESARLWSFWSHSRRMILLSDKSARGLELELEKEKEREGEGEGEGERERERGRGRDSRVTSERAADQSEKAPRCRLRCRVLIFSLRKQLALAAANMDFHGLSRRRHFTQNARTKASRKTSRSRNHERRNRNKQTAPGHQGSKAMDIIKLAPNLLALP
eukprot:753771-Hanusia_phi.AAC.1